MQGGSNVARSAIKNEIRARYKRLTLELSPTRTEAWTAYATAHGLTLGRMITACVERCIAEDSGGTWAEDEQTETETATGDGTAMGNGAIL